jgi:MoaA/NifB/PqqE/SkfB family radical SAM enzyme
LLDTCNYRCTYCFFSPDILGRKLRTYATVEEWRDSFDALQRTCLIHITGGEPTIYPQFAKLCVALTERHHISLNTNLTHRSLSEFSQIVDPSRVNFINAALHIEERDRHSGHAVFLRHIDLLRSKNFPVLISLVATPPALARFEETMEMLRPSGMAVIPKMFRGEFEGRTYPESYTESEKSRFRQLCSEARQAYQTLFERNGEWPTIDMLHDDRHVGATPTFDGISCEAGRLFVKILPNGDVMRCGKDMLGNILDRSFAPRRRPAPYDTQYCYYFCEKYSLPDRPWVSRRLDQWHSKIDRFLPTRSANAVPGRSR